jgi:hypothetical protein
MSASSSLETLPGRNKHFDSSTQLQSNELASIFNASLPNANSFEPADNNIGYRLLTRSTSTPIMPSTKIGSPTRCFGDQFIDSFPFIDSLSQDTLNFTTKLANEKAKKSTLDANSIQSRNDINHLNSHEQLDEKLFRDLIRNYNPPFSIKVYLCYLIKTLKKGNIAEKAQRQ